MSGSSLINKLRLTAEQRILFINAPPIFIEQISTLGEGITFGEKPGDDYDVGLLFVKTIEELERFGPDLIRSVKYDGLIWIAYPKKSSGIKTNITRDTGWVLLSEAGLRPVTQIAIDEVWSALRFRPFAKVGK